MELEPLQDIAEIEQLAARVYQDPANRAATGWHDEADREEAIAALAGLWRRRFQAGWHVFRVLAEGREVGLAGHGACQDPSDPPGLGVYLVEAGRGRGIGTAAALALVERARKRGAETLETVAREGNRASHRMLQRAGFHPVGPCTEEWAVESGEPWLVYRLGPPQPL